MESHKKSLSKEAFVMGPVREGFLAAHLFPWSHCVQLRHKVISHRAILCVRLPNQSIVKIKNLNYKIIQAATSLYDVVCNKVRGHDKNVFLSGQTQSMKDIWNLLKYLHCFFYSWLNIGNASLRREMQQRIMNSISHWFVVIY